MLKHEEKECFTQHQKRCATLLKEMLGHDRNGATLLHYCAMQGNYRAVPLLTKLGADISATVEGQTAIDLACDSATRKALQDTKQVNSEGDRPLHAAAQGKVDIDDVLHTYPDADPLLPDATGWSCIHYACSLGSDDILTKLLLRAKQLKPLKADAPHWTIKQAKPPISSGNQALMGRTPSHLKDVINGIMFG